MAGEQAGELVTSGRNPVQRGVVAPFSPGPVETTNRPAWGFGNSRQGQERSRAGAEGLEERSTVHAAQYVV